MTESHSTTRQVGRFLSWRDKATLLSAAMASLVVIVAVLIAMKPTELILISDPGEVVRMGYTIAKATANLASAVVLGTLVLQVGVVPRVKAARRSLRRTTTRAAAIWLIGAVASSIFTFANISGISNYQSPTYWTAFAYYSRSIGLGQAWMVAIACATAVAIWSATSRSGGYKSMLLIATLGFIPLATQGHASSSASHNLAVTSILVHVLFVSIWVGGLVGLVIVRRTLSDGWWPSVVVRYSTIAGWAFVAVALSGTVAAVIRISNPTDLIRTAYGLTLTGKIVLFVALGTIGLWHRRKYIHRWSAQTGRRFWALVGAEVVLMATASALAAVLARSAPPGSEQEIYNTQSVTAAEALTGAKYPSLSLGDAAAAWVPDPLWLLTIAALALPYGAGIRRRRNIGLSWPARRSIMFFAGLAVLLWMTCGPLAIYTTYSVVAFAATMLLALIAVPVLVTAGRPGRLLASTTPPREDSTIGLYACVVFLRRASERLGVVGSATVWLVVALVSVLPGPIDWIVEDPIGRIVAITAWMLSGTFLATHARRALSRAGGVEMRGLVLGVPIVLAAIGWTLHGPLRLPEWYARMNPSGIAAARLEQDVAGWLIVIAGTALVPVLLAALLLRRPTKSSDTPREQSDDIGQRRDEHRPFLP